MGTAPASAPDAPSRKEIRRLLQRRGDVARERFGYIREALNWEQSEFLTLLPLLLHINHPSLPGFNGSDTPAGIAGYVPDRYTLLSARRHARSLKHERRPQRYPPIVGLYLIGSSGTLGQDRQSDFDIWVCHHPDLTAEQLAALERKTLAIEAHATDLGLQVHFFILHAEGFRQREHNALSDESSGNTQHHLLLEEFYRTGLMLAGRPPLWWIVPPERLSDYRNYCDTLITQRFLRASDWLDFGGLQNIGLGEFFSAAHWQLFKGIKVPYKSLLKLLLFEAFAADFPKVRWLAEEAHARYHDQEEISALDVDPYLLMMRRIENHLARNGETQRLLLARRALYLKSGVRLSTPQANWKTRIFRGLCEEWGWDEGELINLDRHDHWKLPKVIEERNNLVAELSRSYRLLTTLARERDELHQIDMRELSLLGRKLFSSLERRPGKVDLVNPGISANLHQAEIWLRRHPVTRAWQCFLTFPEEGVAPVKTAAGIVELLTWLSANGAIDDSTRIDLPADQSGVAEKEHLHILKALRRHFSAESRHSAPLGEFAHPAVGTHALAVINAMQPIQSHPDGLLMVSSRADPLSFGTRRHNLVAQIDYVHDNNWGELHVAQYVGSGGLLDMLCRHLDLFYQQTRAGTLNCLCNTPGHATAIINRIGQLTDRVLAHFRRYGNDARYILQIGEDYWAINRQRGLFTHHPIGPLADLFDYLGETDGQFRNSEIDAAGLQDSPLPLVLRLNRPGQVQICYQVEARGIRSFLLDPDGAMIQQWLPNAREAHFLAQQQRFFDTLRDWQHPLMDSGDELSLEFMRLDAWNGQWRVQRTKPPAEVRREHTELILATGPRGPWLDGFSLLSGEREFNSVALGDQVYREAAAYLTGFRRGSEPYPLYLSGVLPSEIPGESALSLGDLMRFKVRIEQRLNKAAGND